MAKKELPLSKSLDYVLFQAARFATEYGRTEFDTEHLLMGLLSESVEPPSALPIDSLELSVADIERVQSMLEAPAVRGQQPSPGPAGDTSATADADALVQRAEVLAGRLGDSHVEPIHLLPSFVESGADPSGALKLLGIDRKIVERALEARRRVPCA